MMPYPYRKQITQQENPSLILNSGKPKCLQTFKTKLCFGVGTLVSSAREMFSKRISHTQGPRYHMERNANTRGKNTCRKYQHSTWK